MPTDFRVFRERLAHACRVRNMTHDRLCRSIGQDLAESRRLLRKEYTKKADLNQLSIRLV
jgi:hypothetical protein